MDRFASVCQRLCSLLLAGAALLVLPTCEPGSPSGGEVALEQVTQAQRAAPRLLTAPGSFRVSPALSPSGRWVAMAGRYGLGLYLLPAGGGAERVVDPDYRGPWRWRETGAGDVLCYGHAPRRAALDADSGQPVPSCPVRDDGSEKGTQVLHDGVARYFHNSRLGTLTRVEGAQEKVFTLDAGAWGARVSPDGRHAAYCTGPLTRAELWVRDLVTGRTRHLGPGAHPAWTPDGARLVFTRVARVERVGNKALITAADLSVYRLADGQLTPLTATPDRAEMQPRVSADGRSVIYADWRSGAVLVQPLDAGGTP